MRSMDFPLFPHFCLYADDFNCRNVDWDYDNNSSDGDRLAGRESTNSIALLNSKDATSFYSGR